MAHDKVQVGACQELTKSSITLFFPPRSPACLSALSLPAGTSDQPVSSAIVRDKFNNAIEVDSTGANQYLCYSSSANSSAPSPLPASGQTQFYLNGQPSLLLMRTVNYPVTLADLTGACVLLPIAAAQVRFQRPCVISFSPHDTSDSPHRFCWLFLRCLPTTRSSTLTTATATQCTPRADGASCLPSLQGPLARQLPPLLHQPSLPHHPQSSPLLLLLLSARVPPPLPLKTATSSLRTT